MSTIRNLLSIFTAYAVFVLIILVVAAYATRARADVKLEEFFVQKKYSEAYGAGYVHGLMTGMAHGRVLDLEKICFPQDKEMDDKLAILTLAKHLDDHPDQAEYPLSKAMFRALSVQYGCGLVKSKGRVQ